MHATTEETPVLEAIMQTVDSDREYQATTDTVGLTASLFTDIRNEILVLQAHVVVALQK